MARVLLLMPPLASPLGSPYLGQLYLAAALREAGHQVRGVDLAAARFIGGEDALHAAVAAFDPQLVGVTLFTTGALAGYRLLARLVGAGRLLVAGGPHATVQPREALARGFDAVVCGEGERALVALAAAVDAHGPAALAQLPPIEGVWRRGGHLVAAPVEDLDALPFPALAAGVFDPAWYVDGGQGMPSGTVTSRGCPAACTFCANHVTGRAFRWRSTDNVLAELRLLVARHGARHIAFWDDAFTARRARVEALCDAMAADPVLSGVTWSCITPANMVRPPTLARMAAAGCRSINFGIESGDPAVLKAIGKGARPERLLETVRAAREVGMQTVVNFMFGFPEEDEQALDRTEALMVSLTPYVDYFNQHGVLVPMPGTPVYERHHEAYGFSRWWLDPARLPARLVSPFEDPQAARAMAANDPTLEADFFRYSDGLKARIAGLVRFKAGHNEATVGRLCSPAAAPGPARG